MSDEPVVGIECCGCFKSRTRRAVWALYLGQIVSLCLCGTALTSSALALKGVNTPAAQSFTNYLLLALVYGTWLAMRREHGLVTVIGKRGWRYALLALVDVEANYLVVMAYQYTNLTSIQILDCFTIPVVLLLSWLTLHTRYLVSHIIGVAICLAGVASLIYADVLTEKSSDSSTGSNKFVGDLLILAGASLYGVSNVCTEFFVKSFSRVEYLGMIGIFGSVISGLQLAIFERHELNKVKWDDVQIIGYYVLFALCMFVLYSLLSVVMEQSSATLYNLSILTADVYALIAGLFLFNYTFHWLYFAALFLVIIGSIIYTCRPTHRTDDLITPDQEEAQFENPDARRSTCSFCKVESDSASDEITPQMSTNHLLMAPAPPAPPPVSMTNGIMPMTTYNSCSTRIPPTLPTRLCPLHGGVARGEEEMPLTRV